MPKLKLTCLVYLVLHLFLTTAVNACSLATPIIDPIKLVKSSDAIIVAYLSNQAKLTKVGDKAHVVMKCMDVIKGSPCDSKNNIHLLGIVWDKNELNEGREIPIHQARASADSSCITNKYTPGALYLLILKRKTKRDKLVQERYWGNTQFTPYWQALAPTNEQITGLEDSWVDWVKAVNAKN